jgi:hypothetical protein
MADVTQILSAIEQGDPHAAGQLLPQDLHPVDYVFEQYGPWN